MLAALCGCVKYSEDGCQECTQKNARGDRRQRMAEKSEPAQAFHYTTSPSGC